MLEVNNGSLGGGTIVTHTAENRCDSSFQRVTMGITQVDNPANGTLHLRTIEVATIREADTPPLMKSSLPAVPASPGTVTGQLGVGGSLTWR